MTFLGILDLYGSLLVIYNIILSYFSLEKLQDITKKQFHRQTNFKDDYTKQMLTARTRHEYYRLTNVYASKLKSDKLNEKEKICRRFYKEKDLFEIEDLSKIQKIIFGEDLDSFLTPEIATEEELFERNKNENEKKFIEQNIIEDILEDEPTSPDNKALKRKKTDN